MLTVVLLDTGRFYRPLRIFQPETRHHRRGHVPIEHYQQALEIAREIGNRGSEGGALCSLGSCYRTLGQIERAIEHYQQALEIAREIGNRGDKGFRLGALGYCYSALGQKARAIQHCEQALKIAREIGDRIIESDNLTNIGQILTRVGEFAKAAQKYEEAIRIADEIGYSEVQNDARLGLARAHLLAGDLIAACTAAEAARQYNSPRNNANLLALLGVISLRQGDSTAAQEAFEPAVVQAGELLSYSEQNYGALDSKGLALSGLALCEENGDHIPAASDCYRTARTLNKDVGIVGDILHLFDELAREDLSGMLAEVRAVAAGE